MPKSQKTNTRIEATVHDEAHRSNIPTTELGAFLDAREKEPKPVLYPRDPSLDPQLVWKGKDEQDRHPLEVPAVPIYIQEKIHPKALIEALRAEKAGAEAQLDLWGDFDGIQFEDLVEFYQHEQNWSNRMILGDSLLVMTSLAEKEGLKGEVQMIYMDPPYGIKFGSNWQVSTRKRDVRDGKAEDTTRQPEQVKAFRDTWEMGIHSYLTYLRDRLAVCRELLADSGSLFMQIGDENVHLVRSVLDEIFGAGCHVVTIVVKKKGSQKSSLIDPVNDYILWYSKTSRDEKADQIKFRPLLEPRALDEETVSEFNRVDLNGKTYRLDQVPDPDGVITDYRTQPSRLFADHPKARLFRPWPITNGGYRANQMGAIEVDGRVFTPPSGCCWRHTTLTGDGSLPGMERIRLAQRLVPGRTALDFKRYLDDFPFKTRSNWWDGLGGAPDQVYVVQTNMEIVKRCLLMTTDPGDLVLDPTCGSGTTAYVAEQWGRRWITIDTSRVALALARQRLMAAKLPYYILADSPDGARLLAQRSGDASVSSGVTAGDIGKGFVYRHVPHVTSGAIANNPGIREGMSREESDAAIAHRAEQEILYDQPYEDKKVVRVTGPFTVESLSPHIMLPLSEARANESEDRTVRDDDVERFQSVVLGHLRKAGVQNTIRSERLVFASIEQWAGRLIHAVGTYSENGIEKRAAISIGPEYGTIDADLVRQAAKEAAGFFDLLIVCGFAFDGYIAGELRKLGSLTILKATMNPDLAMGDELLKKTGSGNLFMVFGEPDIEPRATSDGLWEIEVKGVDVYNPTTGEIRSHSTDDIACWFIDTSYNGESFFVRHAYFCGGNDPYESLKRALRADIDEEAWSSLYRTTSRPFPAPETGRIAVKVINHYGDEVMKVVEVGTARN